MILHLVNDEKIINRTVNLFAEVAPKENLFVVFSGKKGFKHVRFSDFVISKADFLARKKEFTFSAVVIHFLNTRKIRLLRRCDLEGVPVYWIIWGADLYNKLLEPKGFEMLYRKGEYYDSRKVQHLLKYPFERLKSRLKVYKTMQFVKKRVNYLVTDTTENDYDVFARYYPEVKQIPRKDFFYYPIDEILGTDLLTSQVVGNNILIGNSCSLTNNHEYAFKYLAGLKIENRKIIVPLSYSGNRAYRKSVIDKGRLLFGDLFCPLTDFLPLEQYNEWMKSASVAIYANWRQEAIGNIIIALYLGAKVFLPVQNPVFAWACGHGLKVVALEEISQHELDSPLTEVEKSSNRKILLDLYHKKRFIQLVREIFPFQNPS